MHVYDLARPDPAARRVFEIAESIGYESSGYFIGVFKRRFGVSPLAYRRQALADPTAKTSP